MDLRFADDILLFAGSAEQLGYMLDKLVTSLENVDSSSATTKDIDDPRWFGDCSVGPAVVPQAGLCVVDIDWNQPWHTILHAWHRRIDQQLEYHGFKMWSTKYLSEYWKFANYVALLDDNRWVKRILHWNPGGGRSGRPFFQWQTPLPKFLPLASLRQLD